PGFEVPRQLAACERSYGLEDQLGTLRFGIGCKTALQLPARLRPQPFGLDSMLPRRLQAVIAKTQAEQETTEQAELDEVPLVMQAVLETVEVKGLRDDALHALARDVRTQCGDIGAHVGIGRAEVREVCVAERVATRAAGMPGA